MLRVGVVGTAHWAEIVHLPGFAAHPQTELAGVFGRKPERCAELAERFDIETFEDLGSLFEAVDAVSFAVPPRAQAELAARAARCGKHLMLEKPLAAGLGHAAGLVEAVRESGVASLCFLTRLFVPAVEDFIGETRALGPAEAGAVFRSGALLGGSPYSGSAWRQEETGVLWDAAPHPLSVLVATCGPITRISARLAGRGHVVLAADHRGGCRSTAEVNLCDPTANLIERYELRKGDRTATLEGFPYDRGEAFARAISEFVRRTETAGNATDHLALPMHLMAVLDAAEKSVRTKGRSTDVSGN